MVNPNEISEVACGPRPSGCAREGEPGAVYRQTGGVVQLRGVRFGHGSLMQVVGSPDAIPVGRRHQKEAGKSESDGGTCKNPLGARARPPRNELAGGLVAPQLKWVPACLLRLCHGVRHATVP